MSRNIKLIALSVGAWMGFRRLYREWKNKRASRDYVEEASRESFPASDAPAWSSER